MKKKTSFIALLLALTFFAFCAAAFAAGNDQPAQNVTITKNPTSEALNVGGKTWFIAHAENANALTWLMVDPLGDQHSLDQAMALMPGLSLEALEGDTLAVSNVPAELNGWGVCARFDGSTGSAVTEPAYIFVGDFLTAYGSVIDSYRTWKEMPAETEANPLEYDLSEVAGWYESVGYALKDLDKNGIPELIIAGIGSEYEDPADPVFEIYTLENNTPVQLCISYSRAQYLLMRDNRILEVGSGGASLNILELYEVNGTELQFTEGYRTDEDYYNHTMILFHSTSYEAFYNDYAFVDSSSPDVTVVSIQDSFNEYYRLAAKYEAQTWVPYLTKIA